MDGACCSLDAVAGVLAEAVGGIFIDDGVHGVVVFGPVDFRVGFVVDEGAVDFEGVVLAASAPGVVGGDGFEGKFLDAVFAAVDVEVGFEGERVVVHATGEEVVDVEAVVGLVFPVCGGDVAREARGDFDGAVVEEGVVDQEVVVADCGYGSHRELDVLRDTGVRCVLAKGMAANWISWVKLKDANGIFKGLCIISLVP